MKRAIEVTPEKKKKSSKKARDGWDEAMSVFTKFKPGLGHDGRGLYGTLTNSSVRRVLDRLRVRGRTHLDVGAADGKVMLGALALGAERSLGVEVAGESLGAKFRAMAEKLGMANGRLECETDVTALDEGSIEGWVREVFGVEASSSIVVVTAVWHGFTVEAKECVLRALARSATVAAFSLVGPMRKEYGTPRAILDYLARFSSRFVLTHDDKATLAGGESYRALTFAAGPGCDDDDVVVPL